MLKILKADKDSYITDKIVGGTRKTNANVGAAGTLDLFKLYGATFSGSNPNTEKSRILVHFDLDDIRDLVSAGKLDTNDSSFWCKLHLKDVYGGQPSPTNFTVSVFPLSASFDEGVGRDVSYYADYDTCNWLTASLGTKWYVSGCSLTCAAQSSPGDYITSSVNLASTEVKQTFVKGDEDLVVDVTSIVSATLSGELPDSGFRISFQNTLETNNNTYFVKRFGARTAHNEVKRPHLTVGFDDSITDDTQNLTFDSACKITLYNSVGGSLSNILSGSSLTQITGSNCLVLKLLTEISGGYYDLVFSGSQFTRGIHPVSGTYQATVTIPSSNATIKTKLAQSGSVNFLPVWASNDLSVGYVTGSVITARPPIRTGANTLKSYSVSVNDVKSAYKNDEEALVRVHIFDQTNPYIKLTKVPINLNGIVVKNVYYQIRDVVTGEVIIPFDDTKNSTKVSSDFEGMFFNMHTSSLRVGRTYTIDVMISQNGIKTKFESVSPDFRIEAS